VQTGKFSGKPSIRRPRTIALTHGHLDVKHGGGSSIADAASRGGRAEAIFKAGAGPGCHAVSEGKDWATDHERISRVGIGFLLLRGFFFGFLVAWWVFLGLLFYFFYFMFFIRLPRSACLLQ